MTKTMTAKEYLNQTQRLEQLIHSYQLEVEQLKQLSVTVEAVTYTERIPSGNKATEPPFVKILMKIADREEKINQLVDELVDLKIVFSDVISKMTDVDERTLLTARYVNGKSWEVVYKELHRSKSATHRIHSSALRNFVVPK